LPKKKKKKKDGKRNEPQAPPRLMGKRTPLLLPRALSLTPRPLSRTHTNSHPLFSSRREVKVQKPAES
jgi:hypothetical protein